MQDFKSNKENFYDDNNVVEYLKDAVKAIRIKV